MKRICVYCGSSLGKHPDYTKAAHLLAEEMFKRDIGLIYGGASIGIMGQVADAVLALGGEVIGVIPRALALKEVSHSGLTELKIVGSMHERKTLMTDLADGFIALPGGLGTLEELFEILTWAQLGFHQKPCGLLNIGNYYDSLVGFLDHAVDEAFIKPIHRSLLQVSDCPSQLLDAFASFQPSIKNKWIKHDET
ncbi:MAG: TIGR00730 family Rossman fold protein [Nitrosomonas sp.]|jgi:uncharacterized protein (TIGR00730 family)|nr:TIGR00730 family Rossman fold protein [Nitrosomonas sp.]